MHKRTTSRMADARILPPDTVIEHHDGGTIHAHSPHPLGPYPVRITERLEHWARYSPDRTFLAQRDAAGDWRRLTYADALASVRAVAQAFLNRTLSSDRPVAILSGNGIEHAIVGLAAMYAGVPYAPLAPAYALVARDYTTLRSLWRSIEPGLVFVADAGPFERALTAVSDARTEIVTCVPSSAVRTTDFAHLHATVPTAHVDDVHARVGPDTVAKILYTSGSTGRPKGVINTQRMLCANQEMIRTVLPLLADQPPVLCDWLPWNHTFGGNHNFGIVLYNGGTLYIDEGKPTPAGFATTIRNLSEIATTAYFNVPRGYDLLVPRLRDDEAFRSHFFSRLTMLFCAAASLRQQVADDLVSLAVGADGAPIPLVTGLGATETAPFAICAGNATFTGGRIGVPVPGVELKLAPVGRQMEGRLRGPSITPGYWRDEALTRDAFDDEGFYRLGDALAFLDPSDPSQGFAFHGRIAEDFKLSTGTWVRVGALRARLLAQLGDLAHDVVIAGHDRDFVAALIFPNLDGCCALCGPDGPQLGVRDVLAHPAVRARIAADLAAVARDTGGSSMAVVRAVLLDHPPSIDAHETTEKGSVNQKAVLANRAHLVDDLYNGTGSGSIRIDTEVS